MEGILAGYRIEIRKFTRFGFFKEKQSSDQSDKFFYFHFINYFKKMTPNFKLQGYRTYVLYSTLIIISFIFIFYFTFYRDIGGIEGGEVFL